MSKKRVVHCLNQFMGGLGAEERADMQPAWFDGARGPGNVLERLCDEMEVVGTVVFGDNFVATHTEDAVRAITGLIRPHAPDLVIVGPAFQAGRYGLACGAIAVAVEKSLGVPALTAMHRDNPAVEVYRRDAVIVATGASITEMKAALQALSKVGHALIRGEDIWPESHGISPHGYRRNVFVAETGAERAVTMLIRKLRCEPFTTEYRMPVYDRVPPAPPVEAGARYLLALVTSGGIVPRGNPDRIPSASAHTFGEYAIEGLERLDRATHECVHGGYDPTYANADPNRVLPLDAVRALEHSGRIGRLYHFYYATVGNATEVARAQHFGREIAGRLREAGVQAVILTST